MKSAQSKMLIPIIILMILLIGVIAIFASDVYLPKNMRYLRYMVLHMNPPKDLYNPIVKGKFEFTERGFTKAYSLEPKYSDFYDLRIELDKKVLSSKHKFGGKYKMEFMHNDAVLFEEIVKTFKSWGSHFEDGYDMDYYQWIILQSFEIPFQGKYKENISIRITVLEPDEELNKYKNSIQLLVQPRSIH